MGAAAVWEVWCGCCGGGGGCGGGEGWWGLLRIVGRVVGATLVMGRADALVVVGLSWRRKGWGKRRKRWRKGEG